MLFNTTEFLGFFGLFFLLYLLSQNNLSLRNLIIVVASYVFYGAWDERFLVLLFLTSLTDYMVGRLMERATTQIGRKIILATSLTLNLAVLCTFKYFNFFRESFELLLGTLGFEAHWEGWNIVLPVGISFYTFQSMSYVIDVYRRELPASRNLIQFLAYVSFFPQLVAGPIERATNLLPQFARTLKITAENFESGIWLIIWGMFKKVVIADNLAPLVELVYDHAEWRGGMVPLATIAFGLQIYCDFSGYTDIARGLAKLLGFELMLNFNLPYFATSVRDFWGRWHISLSTWFRDYLYIPLGGNRRGAARTYLNLAIVMLLAGLWHGAAATFVLWGAWHAVGLMINHWWSRRAWFQLPNWLGWFLTMTFVFYSWMLFRASSFDQVLEFTRACWDFSLPSWWPIYVTNLSVFAAPLVVMYFWQWRSGEQEMPIKKLRWMRGALQGAMFLIIASYWKQERTPFIYFQF